MDSDLGNVGVQRQVLGYERVEGFTDAAPTWYADLSCGHRVKLDVDPETILPTRPVGRHRDCPECTRLERG